MTPSSIADIARRVVAEDDFAAAMRAARLHLGDAMRQIEAGSPRLAMNHMLKANGALMRADQAKP